MANKKPKDITVNRLRFFRSPYVFPDLFRKPYRFFLPDQCDLPGPELDCQCPVEFPLDQVFDYFYKVIHLTTYSINVSLIPFSNKYVSINFPSGLNCGNIPPCFSGSLSGLCTKQRSESLKRDNGLLHIRQRVAFFIFFSLPQTPPVSAPYNSVCAAALICPL